MAPSPAPPPYPTNSVTIKLNDYWSQRLVQMPETGMGYQKVDLVFKDGRILKGVIVLNAEDCETEEAFKIDDIADIKINSE
jgi:hypothetical protein